MKKSLNRKSFSAMSQVKPDMTELILKMQQQLVILEKKIDSLLSQSSRRPFEAKPHSKPFLRFEQSHDRGEARHYHDRGERILYEAVCADCNSKCEVPFKPSHGRPVYCKECFSKRKVGSSFKPSRDNRPQDRRPAKGHPFDKYMDREKRRHGEKRRPVHKRGRDR